MRVQIQQQELQSNFSIAGYIIRKRQIPIGTDIPANCHESIASLIPGTTSERMIPRTIQMAIQSGKYFSKVLSSFPGNSLFVSD
jgi:hypothetical protein